MGRRSRIFGFGFGGFSVLICRSLRKLSGWRRVEFRRALSSFFSVYYSKIVLRHGVVLRGLLSLRLGVLPLVKRVILVQGRRFRFWPARA